VVSDCHPSRIRGVQPCVRRRAPRLLRPQRGRGHLDPVRRLSRAALSQRKVVSPAVRAPVRRTAPFARMAPDDPPAQGIAHGRETLGEERRRPRSPAAGRRELTRRSCDTLEQAETTSTSCAIGPITRVCPSAPANWTTPAPEPGRIQFDVEGMGRAVSTSPPGIRGGAVRHASMPRADRVSAESVYLLDGTRHITKLLRATVSP
jgi:hypothetical protein